MSPARLLPLGVLLAASGLNAQTVTVLGGGLGAAITTYSQSFDTTGGLRLGVGLEVEYLVVAGGGGGGGSNNNGDAYGAGGGGAGGMLTGTKILSLSSTAANNTFAVSVGAGGTGGAMSATQSLQPGGNGGNSALGDIIALGGGGGGRFKSQGSAGGSGGGGGGRGTGNNLRTAGGAGTDGQGFAGGASRDDDSSGRSAGGGGGGAGGLGGQGGTDATIAGNGGLGLASSITGTSNFYAAGGGGGAMDNFSSETAGTGGSGIGGNGSTSGNASAGAANTGSGGGGAGTAGTGGSGGSGIVVLRYRTDAVAGAAGTGGTVAAGTGTADGYTVHQFTSTGSSSLDLSGLDVANQRMVTKVSGAFTGAGSLQFNGTGLTTPSTFILTGNSSSHTGQILVNAGATLQVGDGGTAGSLGTGDIYVNQGGALVFDRSDDFTVANTLRTTATLATNAGDIVKRGAGTLTLTGTGAASGSLHAGLVRVEEGSVVYDATSRNSSAQVEVAISEGASFVRLDNKPSTSNGFFGARFTTSGAGSLTLAGSYKIALIEAVPGNQNLSYTSSLGHTGGTLIDAAGLYVYNASQVVAGTDFTLRNGGVLVASRGLTLGSLVVESGQASVYGLTADSLEVRSGSMYGILRDATPLLKTGSGEFVMGAYRRDWSGSTRVEDGILRVAVDDTFDDAAVTVAGGTFRIAHGFSANPRTQRLASLTLDGGTVDTLAANATRLDASVLDLRSGTISLKLEGKGVLTKTTAGTVTLEADNGNFAGRVTVSDGVLRLLTTTSLGFWSTVLLEGGTLELAGNTRVGYFEQTGGAINGGTLLSSLILTESGTLGSVLADFGAPSGILKRTAGTTQVTAANTFTGTVNIQQGTLQLDGAGSFASAVRLVTSAGGTLDLAGKAQTLAGIEGDGAIALGTGGALTVSSSSSSIFDGSLGGDGTLVKSGTGTLRLTGAAAHTGGTSVLGGKLVVNGTLGSGAVTVASGATLGGSGTIAGATTISGIHAPGNSPGLQTFASSLSYQTGASIQWELAGQSESEADRGVVFDGIDVAGDLTFDGPTTLALAFALAGSSVDWDDAFWASGHSWKVFDVGGSIVGFSNLTLNYGSLDSLGASLSAVRDGALFTVNLRSGDIFVDYLAPAPIPEPSTYGLAFGFLALASVAVRRRARRHSGTAARN